MPHPPPGWKNGVYGQNVAWGFPKMEDAMKRWFEEYVVSIYFSNAQFFMHTLK